MGESEFTSLSESEKNRVDCSHYKCPYYNDMYKGQCMINRKEFDAIRNIQCKAMGEK